MKRVLLVFKRKSEVNKWMSYLMTSDVLSVGINLCNCLTCADIKNARHISLIPNPKCLKASFRNPLDKITITFENIVGNPFSHNCNKSATDNFWNFSTNMHFLFNPFPHIDAFWRLCSRRLFENIVTKEEISAEFSYEGKG